MDQIFDDRLAVNIIDVIKEEQIKLGYQKEKIRLYYPLSSLNTLLGENLDSQGMKLCLDAYFSQRQHMFGPVGISYKAERFCVFLPEQATEYVHENTPSTGFLYDFIELVSKHGVSADDILELFKKYSDKVFYQKMEDEEFDYLIYFEDGKPDGYRYCLKNEGHHLTYHRYTKDDFEDLFGDSFAV